MCKKSRILWVVLLVLCWLGAGPVWGEVRKGQQRIEFTQWYTSWGERDVFEIMQYNADGFCTSQVVLLNDMVVESSFTLYDGDKIVAYDLEGKLRSVTETAGNKTTHYYYFSGSPGGRTESIRQEDKTRYISYRTDNVIDEMYDEIIFAPNCKLIRWFDPEQEAVVREEVVIEKYDQNGLLVYQERAVNGVTVGQEEYSYDVVYDDKERPVLINGYAVDDNGKRLIYSRRIEYADQI